MLSAERKACTLIILRPGSRILSTARTSQCSLIAAQREYTRVSGDVATNLIALYKAVGGGWETRKQTDFVPDAIKQEMDQRTNWAKLLKPEQMERADEDKKSLWRFPDW